MRINYKNKEILQKSIENYLVKNPNSKKAVIVNHFLKQGYVRRTLYSMLEQISDRKPSNES